MMYVAFLCVSGQESAAESTRIFRRAASSGTECYRPSDGQQQRSIAVGYDRLWDAKADYLKHLCRENTPSAAWSV